MELAAKLITAIAALLAAVTWPALILSTILLFRAEIRSLAARMPSFLDRVRKMKLAGIEAELDALADQAPKDGAVTADQTRAAARIAMDFRSIGQDPLLLELDSLCLQYDGIRQMMTAGATRTREMTRIVVKMRALAPAVSNRIFDYKTSASAGRRLAAIAMMQMDTSRTDLDWLLGRFGGEAPFLFFHAALALTQAANEKQGFERKAVIAVAEAALEVVRAFCGKPDANTITVLQSLVSL